MTPYHLTSSHDQGGKMNLQEYLISTSRSEEYDEDTRERLPVQDQYKLGPRIGTFGSWLAVTRVLLSFLYTDIFFLFIWLKQTAGSGRL